MSGNNSQTSGKRGRADALNEPHTEPGDIRNVVLVGHAASGKTSLIESLLLTTGAITRAGRIEDGNTTSDHEAIEHRMGRSVALSVVSLMHDDVLINLIDTPGHADFVGEVRAGLRAADAALFVVSAVDGIDGVTRRLWEECAAVGMPRAVVLTHIDQNRADVEESVDVCRRVFGDGVQSLYLPVLDGAEHPAGLLGLLSQTVIDYSGSDRTVSDADDEQREAVEPARAALIEGIITESEDDSLLDRWLGGEQVSFDVLVSDLEKAVARGSFHPVVPVVATSTLGGEELLEVIVRGFPSPLEHPLPAVTTPDGDAREALVTDPGGPLVAEVVKTTSDPYVGRLSIVRIFSGTLVPEKTVHVSGHFTLFTDETRGAAHPDHDIDERIGTVSRVRGATLTPVDKAVAGDVVAIARLAKAETGDTLSEPEATALMEPWVMPEPLLPVALLARSSTDDDKLVQGLARIVAEDPTTRVEVDPNTHQMIVWTMGESHLEVIIDKLRERHSLELDTEPVRVALRETLRAKGSGHGRHVKQSGGHGQYAVCDVDVEPLPEGSGFEFVDKVVGGSVPRQFIPSVEKGVRSQLERGVVTGYPMVDVRVTLTGGKAHSVDSSDAAFQLAGALALKEAAGAAGVSMLEPVDDVRIIVDDEYVGAIMGDLSSRRGRVTGTTVTDGGRTEVSAEVPAIELTRYATDLRSLAHGTGVLQRNYLRHAPMPQHHVDKMLADSR